jgi:ABC-type proline/glycine betaine transport system ATPase subunit
MGIVFQNLGLFPHLSVAGNVMFPLRMHGVSRTESRRRAEAMLDRVPAGAPRRCWTVWAFRPSRSAGPTR